MAENNLYFYLSHLLLNFFLKGRISDGSKYHVKFEKYENVSNLYEYLRLAVPQFVDSGLYIGDYKYNDYVTFYIDIKGTKLIIASHPNEDLLTGLRNNFQKVEGFEQNSAIFFIHSSELESINKGAESLSNKAMPLHYGTVSENILKEFDKEPAFSQSQRYFLKELIKAELKDYQIENSNVFDLKKYLVILLNRKLTRENYNELGVFFDKKIQDGGLSQQDIRMRVEKNSRWFSEISIQEEHGTLKSYLERHFDNNGQAVLGKKENWSGVTFDQVQTFQNNKNNKPFNEYIPISEEVNPENLVLWEREEGTSKSKSKIKNIIIFNDRALDEVSINLEFKKRPKANQFESDFAVAINEQSRYAKIVFPISNALRFFGTQVTFKETLDGQTNNYRFKILIVPFSEALLRSIRSSYSVQIRKNGDFGLEISSENEIIFNADGLETTPFEVMPFASYELNNEEKLIIQVVDKDSLENGKVIFKLQYDRATLFCHFLVSGIERSNISGSEVWRLKNQSQKSFYYSVRRDLSNSERDVICLEHATKSRHPIGDFRASLRLEESLIDSGFISSNTSDGKILTENIIDIPSNIIEVYKRIIDYFLSTIKSGYRLLPSTVYIEGNLKQLYQEYVQTYFEHLSSIKDNEALAPQYRDIISIGTIRETNKLKTLKLTPLHPLIIAYQLKVLEEIDLPFLDEDNKEMIEKLNPNNLLPFINNGSRGNNDFFIAIEQEHSPEWMYYVNASVEGQSINRSNAAEMIAGKIQEFVGHFSFLYMDSDAPIRLNLINVGDGKEALQGIFEYFSRTAKNLILRSRNPNEVYPIRINIYGEGKFITYFEQFSKFEDPDIIRDKFGIDLKSLSGKMEVDDFLKLYHEKVQFFIKNTKQGDNPTYEYSHISFYQFSEDQIEKADNNTLEVPTGISLGGLISDLPSIYIHGNYRTGFGIKSLEETGSNNILNISKKLNSLAQIEGTSNIYKDGYAFASVIKSNIKSGLGELYSASQWVTFINPRIDLSFFKKDKGVVIIHYTDQYSNSSGYDSITITTKYEQYEFIIREYLESKIETVGENIKPIINMFNALNGYWLLKLGSQNQTEHVNKEKISILSAVKEALAILDHNKITWMVLSLEEILRVTGSAGLKQSSGLFSVANLRKKGEFTDDLLMAGIEEVNGELMLYFYPIEVKTGVNSQSTLEKGGKQGKNTFDLLITTLAQKGLKGKTYRNYMAKLILNAAQKLSLYEIWPEYTQRWDNVENWRGKLLDDNFTIGSLRDYIGDYALLSFKKNESFGKRSMILENNQLNINLYENDGLNDLVLDISKLKERYTSSTSGGITALQLLSAVYIEPIYYNLIEDHIEISGSEVPQIGGSENLDDFEDNEDLGESPIIDIQNESLDSSEQENNNTENGDQDFIIESSDPPEEIEPLKIVFGSNTNNGGLVEWFPTNTHKVMHTNTGIIGTMGTGKTQFNKSLITQLIRNTANNVSGKKMGILIFDYKGDYISDDFIKATDAKVFDLHQLPFNPFALSTGKNPKKLLPLHTAATFQDTIKKAFGLGNKQDLVLFETIMDAYIEAGIYQADPSTWDRPAPTMKDVFELYLERDKVSKDSLFAALNKLYTFEIFESNANKTKPLFDLIDGVTIINLKENSSEIQNLIVAITLDQFYAQMQIAGHSHIDGKYRQINKMILVDEADNFLSKNFESLRKILKEGREYGVGTILSTQFLNHFTTADNEYSQYILTWIIHRVNEIKDKEVASLFDLPNKKDREELVGEIKGLEIHHSIVNLANGKPIKIKDKAFWELKTM